MNCRVIAKGFHFECVESGVFKFSNAAKFVLQLLAFFMQVEWCVFFFPQVITDLQVRQST